MLQAQGTDFKTVDAIPMILFTGIPQKRNNNFRKDL